MYFSSHLCTGLLMGGLTNSSVAAFGIGFISHGILDMFPHHDYNSIGAAALDIVIGVITLKIFQANFQYIALPLFWGALGATVPDLEVALKHLLPRYRLKPLYPSHNGLFKHPQRAFPKGVFVQAVVVVFTLFLTWYIS